ncbi:hypothetical protein [Rhodovulum euryhalinum]|uniref:Uncharacterized protein n=1 Tax=Rhodovulum euryhalinum TaxID=35805 RepID=A0A4R2KNE0_9RHOB|nr:hypothetical protein [Rhodovulum euryhalinum]TCO74087.1 hypothetical protein EV655_101244 [Rhodovulum euryhalinum]
MLRVVLSAALLWGIGGGAAVPQQTAFDTWMFGDGEFRQNAAWILARTGRSVASLTVECDGGIPYVDFEAGYFPQGAFSGQVVFGFAEGGLALPATYDSSVAEPGWRSVFAQELYDRFRTATGVSVDGGPLGAATFPLDGAAAAIDRVLAGCAATARAAPAGAAPDAATLTLAFVQGRIAEACPSGGSFGRGALVQTDIDGDGLNDYLVDWGEVSCPPMGRGAGFCGAALCTIDVYASSIFRPGGYPQAILGLHKEVQPFGAPFQLRVQTRHGPVAWRWTGTELQAQ